MKKENIKKLPNIIENFSEWYQEIIYLAGLAENCDIKGCIIVLPYGNAIWENITKILNQKIKQMGALNMSFPMLIPYSFLEKEKDHVEGFAPEVAVVTYAGGKQLEEPLVIRPTSEVIIHDYFARKIKSWRNLPMKVNQWCSVIRWEKRPRAFLRTTEFWWQEGHTAHADYLEALNQAEDAIKMYADFCRTYLAIPVIMGKKPDYERFAGADITWTIEGMMQDGKAVQMGTSHLLGEGFAKAQKMEFQDKDMKTKIPFLTSWGVTTRLIGTLIMVHGDEKGLVIPPLIAPILLILIPIYKNMIEKNKILLVFEKLRKILDEQLITFSIDDNEEITPGAKFFDSEIKGIPFRIEIGMREMEKGEFTFYERDIDKKNIYSLTLLNDLNLFKSFIEEKKNKMQERMFIKATNYRNSKIFNNDNLFKFGDELIKNNGFYISYWCGKNEEMFKEYQCSVRCLYSDDNDDNNEDFKVDNFKSLPCCIHGTKCEFEKKRVLIAKSY